MGDELRRVEITAVVSGIMDSWNKCVQNPAEVLDVGQSLNWGLVIPEIGRSAGMYMSC